MRNRIAGIVIDERNNFIKIIKKTQKETKKSIILQLSTYFWRLSLVKWNTLEIKHKAANAFG